MAPPPPPPTHTTDNWASLLTGGSWPRGTPGPGWGGWRQRSQGKWVAGSTQHPGWRGLSLGPPVLPSLQTLSGLWSGLRTEAVPRASWGAPSPPFTASSADDRISEAPFLYRETEACLDPEARLGLWGSLGSRSVAGHWGGVCGSGTQVPICPSTSASHSPDLWSSCPEQDTVPSHPGPALRGPALPGQGGEPEAGMRPGSPKEACGRGGTRQ